MKNTCLLLCCSLFFSTFISAQPPSIYAGGGGMQGPPVQPRDLSAFQNIVNINGSDGFLFHRDLYLNQYTVVDGQKVLGIPYLFGEWTDGMIITPDGREYTDYQIKYNVQNQTIFFKSGKDSLEANEDIKEFTLKRTFKDSTFTSRFVNANQYQKTVKPLYYELLLDNDRGQLLKANNKVVVTADGVIIGKSSKYLNLEYTYYYYDKKTKKLSKIKANGDMRSILHLSPEIAAEINVDSYDVSHEDELISLLKLYFEKAKLKGF